jgi:hypothetical protein
MSDAELLALAALVRCEAVIMEGDNKYSEASGYLPQWRQGTGLPQHATELEAELDRRKSSAGKAST